MKETNKDLLSWLEGDHLCSKTLCLDFFKEASESTNYIQLLYHRLVLPHKARSDTIYIIVQYSAQLITY